MKIDPDVFYPPTAPELRPFGAVQTLARWRHEGRGPAWTKSGSRVLYRGVDWLTWLEARRVSTAETTITKTAENATQNAVKSRLVSSSNSASTDDEELEGVDADAL